MVLVREDMLSCDEEMKGQAARSSAILPFFKLPALFVREVFGLDF